MYFEENGTKRKGQILQCQNCGSEYIARLRGKVKKFCSPKCFHTARRNRISLKCDTCGIDIERTSSKIKSKFHFCSRKCKESAQSLDGSRLLRPSHYGSSLSYKHIKKSVDNICVGCSETREFLLCIHHKDGNRENNDIDNLEIVCYNCHVIRHLKLEDGKWIYSTKHLTPRDILDNFMGG